MKVIVPPIEDHLPTDIMFSHQSTDFGQKTDETGNMSSTQDFIMLRLKGGGAKLLRTRGVEHNGISYAAVFPNPIHLFLRQSIEDFNTSENLKATEFQKQIDQVDKEHHHLIIGEGFTNEAYNYYVQYRSSSIIMLVMALEAFLNYAIPNTYIYTEDSKTYDKDEIQSTVISFHKKLVDIIPDVIKQPAFWEANKEHQQNILELYKHRRHLIHMKTNADPNYQVFLNHIDKMMDFDILSAINSSVEVMNLIKPNFLIVRTD